MDFNLNMNIIFQYNCLDVSCGGSGGEYEVQIGFGWSNGVTLDFIHLLQDSA
jgi:alpha,alpha-trehalase